MFQREMNETDRTSFGTQNQAHLAASLFFASTFALVFVLGISSNFLVIGVFFLKSQLRQYSNFFFVNLSISDILVLIACMPVTIGDLFSPDVWPYGQLYCQTYAFFEYCFTSASSFTIILISIERFVAIQRPLEVKELFNRRNSIIILTLVWLLSILISLPFLSVPQYVRDEGLTQCIFNFSSFNLIYVVVFYVLLIFVPPVLLIFLYSLIINRVYRYYKDLKRFTDKEIRPSICSRSSPPLLKRHIPKSKSLQFENDFVISQKNSLKRSFIYRKSFSGGERRMTKFDNSIALKKHRLNTTITISLVALAFYLCQLPIRIFLLWSYYKNQFAPVLLLPDNTTQATAINQTGSMQHTEFIQSTNLVAYLTTLVYFLQCISNPIIYNLVSTKFRKAFLKISRLQY